MNWLWVLAGDANMGWIASLSLLLHGAWILGLVVAFVGRHWLRARIEKGIQHGFDRQIEAVRSELKREEEKVKTDLQGRIEELKAALQARDRELASLRDGVLSGRAQRQAMLDKRRIEAVERVWLAVSDLAQHKFGASLLHILDLDATTALLKGNPELKAFFEAFDKMAPPPDPKNHPARAERPFVTQPAWAYFTAYQAVLLSSKALITGFAMGIGDARKMLDKSSLSALLKAALPHRTALIDQLSISSYLVLLDELEQALLAELTKMLDGAEIDEGAIKHAAQLVKLANDTHNAALRAEAGLPDATAKA
jgi:hypothetical protein